MSIRDYKITDEQFNEKGMTSLPDTLKGTPYENKRSLEKFTREVVAPQFNAIVDVFADMEESANNWSAEEAQRVQQENARQTAEQERVSAEGQRATNETARLSAEENRISAENDRVTAETARVNAENGRVSAEAGRRAGEKARNVWEMYSASKAYVPGNKVSFDGSSYVCTAATVGHEPTDTAYWLLIAKKGADGAGADDLRQINDALDAIDPTKITAKAAPADGDSVMLSDSADGGKAKRLLWSNVKAALGKLFVPLARKVNGKALTEDVTLTGENIAVSTADPTPISGAIKYRTNPNLLDNWYFANPVNQRNGYIVPAGVAYYKVDGFVPQGPIPETVRVDYIDYAGSAIFNYGGAACYVPKDGGYVRGYTEAGYTVDRWFLEYPHNLKIDATGLHFTPSNSNSFTNLIQKIPDEKWATLNGKMITVSALTSDGKLLYESGTWTPESGPVVRFDNFEFSCSAFVNAQSYQLGRLYVYAGKSADVLAVKAELGDTQTLAHKENGVWVLNEIPDFGEQLRRCVYYAEKIEDGNTPVITNATFIPAGATSATFVLPYERKRTSPSIRFNDVSNYRVIVRSMSGNTSAFGISNISILDVGTTKASVLVTFSSATSQDWYGYLQRADNTSGGYAFISADL